MLRKEKVVDIEPIWVDSVTILNDSDLEKIVELPLLEPCKELFRKNIRTIASSCNKFNAIGLDKYGNNPIVGEYIKNSMGMGEHYAWIMIDYDSLCETNKKVLESIYESNNDLVLYSCEDSFLLFGADEKFREKCNKGTLNTHSHYGYRVVTLRYPLAENTTSLEVSNYYINIVNELKKEEKELCTGNEIRAKLFNLAKKYERELKENNINVSENSFLDITLMPYDTPMNEMYGVEDESNILTTLFVLETLSLNGMLEETSSLQIESASKDMISFTYNGKEYEISNRTNNENTISFGDYNKGLEHLKKEKELLDLFKEFDYGDYLYYMSLALKSGLAHFPGF